MIDVHCDSSHKSYLKCRVYGFFLPEDIINNSTTQEQHQRKEGACFCRRMKEMLLVTQPMGLQGNLYCCISKQCNVTVFKSLDIFTHVLLLTSLGKHRKHDRSAFVRVFARRLVIFRGAFQPKPRGVLLVRTAGGSLRIHVRRRPHICCHSPG